MQRRLGRNTGCAKSRSGQTLDVVLMMTAILPFVALSLRPTRQIIALVYELTCDLVASPFM
jgi:hypothetical protein